MRYARRCSNKSDFKIRKQGLLSKLEKKQGFKKFVNTRIVICKILQKPLWRNTEVWSDNQGT